MKKKRAARESRNEAKQKERRNRIRALLVQFGLWDHVIGPDSKEKLLQAYNPPIELSASKHLEGNEGISLVLRELRQALQDATFDCPLLGNYSIVDYFSYVMPLAHKLKSVRCQDVEPEINQKLHDLVPLTEVRTHESAIVSLYCDNLCHILLKHSRLDRHLYSLDWNSNRTSHGRLCQQLTLSREQPEERTVIMDGKRRRVYRSGLAKLGGVEWTQWQSATLGLKDEDRSYPVFLQRHVLERLKERGRHVFGKSVEGQLHFFLALSLQLPKIHTKLWDDGAFLVEYYFGEYKIGYLVAEKVDDLILVQTFLFLTMDGTPEGDKLKKRFKLDRIGKEFTGIDDLWTFLGTDLVLDAELVQHFQECGCGHLFKLGKDLRINRVETGYSAEIRKYLRLKPARSISVDHFNNAESGPTD